ncbi:MAG: LysM peptidoglycan-binding domain-containing protein [Acidimicrobiales bacterium]|nr:LysM peptidoglycan-binding domain-containing protein [Acidimicrobiales bacterium]
MTATSIKSRVRWVALLTAGTLACTAQKNPAPPIDTSPSSRSKTTTSAVEEFREKYVVVKGDTLIAISDRFGIDLNDLVRENNIADPTLIYVGQVLLIPPPPDEGDGPLLTIPPPTDPLLPPLEPTTSTSPP